MIDEERLKILTDGAKYDVSCSSSGSGRKNTRDGLGNASMAGICHSFTQDGRCISLLKMLMSNDCVFDCVYCPNRRSADVPRRKRFARRDVRAGDGLLPAELYRGTVSFLRRPEIARLHDGAAAGNHTQAAHGIQVQRLYPPEGDPARGQGADRTRGGVCRPHELQRRIAQRTQPAPPRAAKDQGERICPHAAAGGGKAGICAGIQKAHRGKKKGVAGENFCLRGRRRR